MPETEEPIIQKPDGRLGTYRVRRRNNVPAEIFENCYPVLACDSHTNTLKICRSVGDADKYGEREEIVLAMFSSWIRVDRVGE